MGMNSANSFKYLLILTKQNYIFIMLEEATLKKLSFGALRASFYLSVSENIKTPKRKYSLSVGVNEP